MMRADAFVAVATHDGCWAIFAFFGVAHLAAKGGCHNLLPVAKAQHRNAKVKHFGVNLWSIGRINACRSSTQNNGCRSHFAHFTGGNVARNNFGIHVQIAHASGNKLPVLSAEVEYSYYLIGAGGGARGDGGGACGSGVCRSSVCESGSGSGHEKLLVLANCC